MNLNYLIYDSMIKSLNFKVVTKLSGIYKNNHTSYRGLLVIVDSYAPL